MKIDRLLSIIIMLLNRDKISADELADKFEVSTRTIYRDIDTINQAGVPIISRTGANGGFGIVENYKINHKFFSLDDIRLIVTSLESLGSVMASTKLKLIAEKMNSIVPKDKREEFDSYFEHIVVDGIPWGAKKKESDNEKHKTIYSAICSSNVINIDYSNQKNERVKRDVEPITLILKGLLWYLFAYCRHKDDYRLFKLSRIKEIHISEEHFEPRGVTYDTYNWNDSVNVNLVELTLKFSPKVKYKVEDYFEEADLVICEDGDILVKVIFPEDEWVYQTILSYGDNVEVLEPEHIRKIIKDQAEKIYKKY